MMLSWRSPAAIFMSFFSFHLSQLLFSISLSAVSSPQPKFRLILPVFLAAAAVSGYLSAVSFCGLNGRVGFKGFASGLFYAFLYIYKRRWVLNFPNIQRPPFFSFKMEIPSATARALKLSAAAYLFSSLLLVLLTERFIFAPPIGSAAAEINPSEPLLAALEESSPTSLLKYLAYLDLCMVCENNVDYWRRAALFEESGETYRRVVAVCLRPLEQIASNLGQTLEVSSDGGKAYQKFDQLQPSTEPQQNSKCYELINNFQLYTWSARAIASLTAHSRKEDRFGVAQLSGSNAAVISTLLSCLLAVETFMGKKTSLQPSHPLMGPAGIKWATLSTGRRDVRTGKKRGGPLYSKADAMADVLRSSINCIVCAFHDDMLTNAKAGTLEKDWITSGRPPFGSREMLLQKLNLFLDAQAS
ncbi:Nucleoporin protein Ndc1-Nup [Corchorus capsularis]|uniref:Nucleoporin protein Ndc1-Nup n=1 Tax=Corchorus capsularis TaxID=210143 RepID=A0A1R3J364_COCAP|nr:Nucleoporin protein Ndc1-Nup [Corchorus capsularis]